MELPIDSFKLTPYKHQITGVEKLVTNRYFALFDEMGAGKTKQTIDAAGVLHVAQDIDSVVVVAPATVKEVWLDSELGEIQKHCWVPWLSYEYHSKGLIQRSQSTNVPGRLAWVVTNYEFIRQKPRLDKLIQLLKGRRFLLVFDESSYIKSHRALQTKASFELRKHCHRVVILNGTPYVNNALDLYTQAKIMHPSILGMPNIWAYRNRYCRMGGYMNKQVVGFQNMEELQRKLAPYVLRRKKEDCLDLPDKIYQMMTVPMTPKTWKMYCQMRDEMVAWLNDEPSIASQAIVKMIRLGQLTSGWLGGVDGSDEPQLIGTEKHDAVVTWVTERLEEDPNFRAVVWCRFRAEQEYIAKTLLGRGIPVFRIYGGQRKGDRQDAVREFTGQNEGPAILLGNPQAGGVGLNLVSAHNVMYVSNDYSLFTRLQSEDRCHRPGQHFNVLYHDMIATGPDGQKTIDHAIVRAVRNKQEMANWTTDYWRQVLKEE